MTLRPLFLEFPYGRKDGAPLDLECDNQFMLVAALLIAPAPFAETQDDFDIVFPEKHGPVRLLVWKEIDLAAIDGRSYRAATASPEASRIG